MRESRVGSLVTEAQPKEVEFGETPGTPREIEHIDPQNDAMFVQQFRYIFPEHFWYQFVRFRGYIYLELLHQSPLIDPLIIVCY